MKKRIGKIILLFLCFLLIPSTSVFANERESLERFSGSDELWENLPEEADEALLRSLLEDGGDKGFFKTLIESVLSLFSVGLRDGLAFFAKMGALLIFAALFRALKDSFSLSRVEGTFDFLLFLCFAVVTYSALQDCIRLANTSLGAIQSFFLTSLPVTTMLLTLSGSPASAGTMASSLSFSLAAVSTLTSSLLAPLLNSLFALSVTDQMLDGTLNGPVAWLKKNVKRLCILFFTLICASLALQNALATAADSLAMRSVRFAAGSFIPVVGSLVGESSKMLSAAFSSVKAECGVLCILVLLYVLLRPILFIAVQKIFLGFTNAFSQLVGEKSISAFLKSLSELLDILQALLISESCYLIFYITLFINNRGGV